MSNATLELSSDVESLLEQQNEFLFDHVTKLKKENMKLHRLVCKHKWGCKVMENDPKYAEHLTGCSSYDVFKSLLGVIGPRVKFHTDISTADQLMLTLMKVKHDLPNCFLSKLFQDVDVAKVLDAWITSDILYDFACSTIKWPKKEDKNNEYVVNIINLGLHTFVVIAFTSTGQLCFVSDVSLSLEDKKITDENELIENLTPGDKVYDIRNGVSYMASLNKENGGTKLHSYIKQDFMAMTKARKSVNSVMEKLSSFYIFSHNIKEFRNANAYVKISAALADLNSAKLTDLIQE